jgi:hypothetical protein
VPLIRVVATSHVSPVRYQGAVFAFCLLNLLFFLTVQPYQQLGGELLANGDFSQGLERWSLKGEPERISHKAGVLTIHHTEKHSDVLAQCWRAEMLPQPLLLSAEGRCQAVVRGLKSWHEARIDLVAYDAKGEGLYDIRTQLFKLEGDRSWQRAQALFDLPEASQRVCLEISLYDAPGVFQVRQLSLTPGMVSLTYRTGRWLLLAGWLVLILWLIPPFYRYYRQSRLVGWMLVAGMLLLAGVLMPHETRMQIEALTIRSLTGLGVPLTASSPGTIESVWSLWPTEWNLSKYSHLVGFAFLTALFTADRGVGLGVRISTLLLLAVVTEILQYFVPLRTPRLSDLVVDALGIAIGMGLALGAMCFRQRLAPDR